MVKDTQKYSPCFVILNSWHTPKQTLTKPADLTSPFKHFENFVKFLICFLCSDVHGSDFQPFESR